MSRLPVNFPGRVWSLVCIAGVCLSPATETPAAGETPGSALVDVLFSQIGYDIGEAKRAVVVGREDDLLSSTATFALLRVHDARSVAEGPVTYWGTIWGRHWWVADFSACETPGTYFLVILDGGARLTPADLKRLDGDELYIDEREGGRKLLARGKSRPVHIHRDLLWHETWQKTALYQLDIREELSYEPEGGWKDCGSTLQEASSHAIMVNALCDLLDHAPDRLTARERRRLLHHIEVGADYIAVCQDLAGRQGLGDGAVVHEVRHNQKVVTGNVAKASMVLARAARCLAASRLAKSVEYRDRSRRAFEWIERHGPLVYSEPTDHFAITHGAPYGMRSPPREWMTRDLLMMAWAALERWRAGDRDARDAAVAYARRVVARQVPEDRAEGGLHGHYYTFSSQRFTEKANIHCGAWDAPYKNYNQGGHLPHYVIPLIEMAREWPDHPERDAWIGSVRRFAFGYFLPATARSPFLILPAGYYDGEGLLYFSGWYHGHNKIYGYAAALALEFDKLFGDERFRAVATGNLQWIAGLNPRGTSMVVGVGTVHETDWNRMPGTIINGLEADGQFRLSRPRAATDLPAVLGDEGGIHHPAGWLSGLCRLVETRDGRPARGPRREEAAPSAPGARGGDPVTRDR